MLFPTIIEKTVNKNTIAHKVAVWEKGGNPLPVWTKTFYYQVSNSKDCTLRTMAAAMNWIALKEQGGKSDNN